MSVRKIFLSSTGRDLRGYREAAFKALQKLDEIKVIRMEDFGAADEVPLDQCQKNVAECELLVGILGHCYGRTPPGDETSFTKHEYDEAVRSNIPRLMFVAPEDFPVPAKFIESDDMRQKQQAFRRRVMQERVTARFDSPEGLAQEVLQSVHKWLTDKMTKEEDERKKKKPRMNGEKRKVGSGPDERAGGIEIDVPGYGKVYISAKLVIPLFLSIAKLIGNIWGRFNEKHLKSPHSKLWESIPATFFISFPFMVAFVFPFEPAIAETFDKVFRNTSLTYDSSTALIIAALGGAIITWIIVKSCKTGTPLGFACRAFVCTTGIIFLFMIMIIVIHWGAEVVN